MKFAIYEDYHVQYNKSILLLISEIFLRKRAVKPVTARFSRVLSFQVKYAFLKNLEGI